MKSLLQSAAVFSISLFLLASTARAGAITIVNAGFENDLSRVPNAGDYITNRQTTPNSQPFINGWTVLDVTADSTGPIHLLPGTMISSIYHDSVEGSVAAASNGNTIFQVLADVLMPNTIYTLSMQVGHRLDVQEQGYFFELDAGTDFASRTILARSSTDPGNPSINSPNATDITFAKYIGFFTPVSLTFTTGANPTGLGKPLLIAFGVPAVQTLFDDVHLDASPVGGGIPEPGSMSLLALGGVFVAYLKRK